MGTQVTLTLPDALLERAEVLAQHTGRTVPDLLAETIELSLSPLGTLKSESPVETWSDEQVLAATEAKMPVADDQRLSDLLDQQQAGALTATEQAELTALMQVYQEGLIHKAQALREAVGRGLRGPLQP